MTQMSMSVIAGLLLFLELTLSVEGKVMKGAARLDSMITELYIAKFAFSSYAHGVITGEFKVGQAYLAQRPDWLKHGPSVQYHSLQVAMYNEDAWAKYQTAIKKGSLCTTRLQLATFRTLVPLDSDLEVDAEEQVKFKMDNQISPEQNSHYWYGIVADCSLEEYDAHPPTLSYSLTFKNGDSHLPADEDGMFTSHVIVLFLITAFIGALLMGIQYSLKTTNQVHLAVLIVLAASVFQLMSVVAEMSHLWVYMGDGLGMRWRYTWFPMDFYSEVCQGISELLIQFVLISLAFGWTIIPNTGEAGGFWKALARPYELFKQVSKASIFIITVAITQFTLELAGRLYEDDFNQFHDHEHWPGYILMIMRIGLAALFIYGIRTTKATCAKSAEEEMTRFFHKLSIVGSLWFLTFPILVFMASIAIPQRRHGIVTIGSIVCQSGALGFLMVMLLSKSDYYKISTLRNMGSMLGSGTVRAGKVCVD